MFRSVEAAAHDLEHAQLAAAAEAARQVFPDEDPEPAPPEHETAELSDEERATLRGFLAEADALESSLAQRHAGQHSRSALDDVL